MQVSKEGSDFGSLGIGIIDGCEPVDVRTRSQTQVPFQERYEFLTTEPSLQPGAKYSHELKADDCVISWLKECHGLMHFLKPNMHLE